MPESRPMKHLRGYFEPQEIKRIIDQGETKRDRLLMKTLWHTGARISEIVGIRKQDSVDGEDHRDTLGLQPKNLYPEENRIFLYTIKRTKPESGNEDERRYNFGERYVTIPRSFMSEIFAYVQNKGMDEDERIFPITRVWANEIVKRAGKHADIEPEDPNEKHVHPHHFRHSYAVNYVKKNEIKTLGELVTLQKLLDHKNLMTTLHYLQFSGQVDEEEVERIQRLTEGE